MKNTKTSLIIVDWDDAWATSGWARLDAAAQDHRPLPVKSVGFLIKQDKTGVSIAGGFDVNGNPAGQHFIPKGMITKITKVKY